MRKHYILFVGILLIGFISKAQDLTCADFKIGNFYIPEDDELKNYTIILNDSINEFTIDRDKYIKKWVIIREKNTQTEWVNGLNNGTPLYAIIEWIDDCTYRLTYDGNKTKLKDYEKWVNENNGIVVENVQIIGKCMKYKGTMTTNDEEKISQNGTICKE